MPMPLMSSRMRRASCSPARQIARAVEVRVVDQPLPADRRARLLEVGAHHQRPARRGSRRRRAASARRSRAPRCGSWIEHGPTITTRRWRSRPCSTSRMAPRPSSTLHRGGVGQRQARPSPRAARAAAAGRTRLRSSIGSLWCMASAPENKKALGSCPRASGVVVDSALYAEVRPSRSPGRRQVK